MLRRTCLAATLLPMLARAAGPPEPAFAAVQRARLDGPLRAHGHDALGLGRYPTRLVADAVQGGDVRTASLDLPDGAAFEDTLVRSVDLDGDGAHELVVVRASGREGAALAVYGVELTAGGPRLVERARSEPVGAQRWLNPLGFGDFDGDGRLELVSVATPHVGGVLTLHRYAPPLLLPVAHARDVSNHVYGRREQQLGAVLRMDGRSVVAVPNQARDRLRLLRPDGAGGWVDVRPSVPVPAPIRRVDLQADGSLGVTWDDGGELRLRTDAASRKP